MKRIICWLNEVYLTIAHGVVIDGHDYQEVETMNKREQVLECKRCNHISVGKNRLEN